MPESIGGFWASLALRSDEASFQKGMHAISSLATMIKGLIGFEVLKHLSEFIAKMNETQAMMNVTAAATGITTDQLDQWSLVMKTVSADTGGFISSLRSLKDIVADIPRGIRPPEQKILDMQLLGLSFSDIMKDDPSTMAKKIMEAAVAAVRRGGNKNMITNAVKSLVGESGQTLVLSSLLTGKSIQAYLDEAARSMFTTKASRLGAMGPAQDLNAIKGTLQEIAALFATKFMVAVDPALKILLEYIRTHKTEITETITAWAKAFASLAEGIGNVAGFLAQIGTGKGPENIVRTLEDKYPGIKWLDTAAAKLDALFGIKSEGAASRVYEERMRNPATMWEQGRNFQTGRVHIVLSQEAQRLLAIKGDSSILLHAAAMAQYGTGR